MTHGKDLRIYTSGGTALVAGARSCEIEEKCDMLEVSTPLSGNAREYTPGRTGWSISLGTLITSEPHLLPKKGDTVQIQVRVGEKKLKTGTAIVETCRMSGDVNGIAKGSFKLRGTGELADYDVISVTINGPGSVPLNHTGQYTATITPTDAFATQRRWTSQYPEVATIDASGLLTSVSTGIARIHFYVQTASGQKHAEKQVVIT